MSLCNLCGESLIIEHERSKTTAYGLVGAQVTGGYYSTHLLDMNRYQFSLCELCLRQLFIKCKIPPQINCLFGFDNNKMSFEEDQYLYEFSLWSTNGGAHQAYLNRKCNAALHCPGDAKYTELSDEEFTENCFCEFHNKPTGPYPEYRSSVKFIPDNLKAFL